MVELFRFRIGPGTSLVGCWDQTASAGALATKWTIEYTATNAVGGSSTLESELELREAELIMKGLEHNQREQHHQDDIRHREFQHENYVRDQQRIQWRP